MRRFFISINRTEISADAQTSFFWAKCERSLWLNDSCVGDVGKERPLYHYFASKDEVALAVLDRAVDWVKAQLEKTEGREPIDRLEGYLDMFHVLHGKGERMCPGGSFGSVFDAVSSPVQRAVHRFAQVHLDWLETIVREGVELGQFAIGDQRPRDVAMQIVASVQGALLMARLTSDPHVLDTVAAVLRCYLGYARPAPKFQTAGRRDVTL